MKSVKKGNGSKKNSTTGSHLGFEATLWATADKLRGSLDAAEYKHVVLGLTKGEESRTLASLRGTLPRTFSGLSGKLRMPAAAKVAEACV